MIVVRKFFLIILGLLVREVGFSSMLSMEPKAESQESSLDMYMSQCLEDIKDENYDQALSEFKAAHSLMKDTEYASHFLNRMTLILNGNLKIALKDLYGTAGLSEKAWNSLNNLLSKDSKIIIDAFRKYRERYMQD